MGKNFIQQNLKEKSRTLNIIIIRVYFSFNDKPFFINFFLAIGSEFSLSISTSVNGLFSYSD
jgi:hypothetical protein